MSTPRPQRTGPTGVLRRLRGDDDGAALVIVVGSTLVLGMLAMTALAYSLSGQRFSRYDQDYSAAMTAAQSGIDDFISRMGRSPLYGNTPDCTNPAWRGPMTASNTCGWTATTAAGWQPVRPGSTDRHDAYFHYEVDATNKSTRGTVVLTVTGRVNEVYRTLQATIGKGGSTDYVYYTDFESADPSNAQAYGASGTTIPECGAGDYSNAKYWYTGRADRNCVEIQFSPADTLNGAVFSNDTIWSSGAKFAKSIETGDPRCQGAGATPAAWNTFCLRPGGKANFNGVKPRYATPKYLDDNSAAFATNPGCHYYGATRVIFKQDGTMSVWNRKSVNGGRAPRAIAAPGSSAPSCGTVDQLNSAAGASVPVWGEMMLYAASSGTANRQCYGGEIGGPRGKTLPVGTFSAENTVPPVAAGLTYSFDSNMTETAKYCGEGNVYVEGIVQGRVSIAAEQSVIVTGDLVLAGGLNGDDMLGLVATNSVEVFHPRQVTVTSRRPCMKKNPSGTKCKYGAMAWMKFSAESDVSGWPVRYKEPGATGYTPASGIQIAASIQTLQHSFLVQKYSVGSPRGTLLVNGSVAQRWRGIVGHGDVDGVDYVVQFGYAKLYQYDTRLQYTRPPYFPTWANAHWSLRHSGEINTPATVRG